MIMISDNVNCVTISTLRNPLLPNNFMFDKFFKTSTGLKDDNAHAGSAPPSKPVKMLKMTNQQNNLTSIDAPGGTISSLNGA